MTSSVVDESTKLDGDSSSEPLKSRKNKSRFLISIAIVIVIVVGVLVGGAYTLGWFRSVQLSGTTWIADQIPTGDGDFDDITLTFSPAGISKNGGQGMMLRNRLHSVYTQMTNIKWDLSNQKSEGKYKLLVYNADNNELIYTMYISLDDNGVLSFFNSPTDSVPDIQFRRMSR